MDGVQIAIDPDVCLALGLCEHLAPAAVELDAGGVAQPRPGVLVEHALAERLCDTCPSGALTIAEG